MWVNLFEADSYEDEAQVKIVTSLTTDDLIRQIKQGEILSTEWLHSQGYDCEFRIVVQARRVGTGKGGNIIDLKDGGPPLIVIPGR